MKKLDKGLDLRFTAEIPGPNEDIKSYVACEDLVGTCQFAGLKLNIPASSFPPSKSAEVLKECLTTKGKATEDFELSDIDESDMLAAAKTAEAHQKDPEPRRFVDIEEFDQKAMVVADGKTREVKQPTLMPNGKWTCNHHCRGGYLKTGQHCKHKCCHEGLDKPRKPKRKVINLLDLSSLHDIDQALVVQSHQ